MPSTMRFDKWENTLGTAYGTILQVKQSTKTGAFTTSSTSFTEITSLSVVITPRDVNSKFIMYFTSACGQNGNNLNFFTFLRNGTNVLGGTAAVQGYIHDGGTAVNQGMAVSMQYLDSPATAGAITYKVAVRTDANTMWIGERPASGLPTNTTLIVMEVAG